MEKKIQEIKNELEKRYPLVKIQIKEWVETGEYSVLVDEDTFENKGFAGFLWDLEKKLFSDGFFNITISCDSVLMRKDSL